jgi:hypothetical protein
MPYSNWPTTQKGLAAVALAAGMMLVFERLRGISTMMSNMEGMGWGMGLVGLLVLALWSSESRRS